MEIQGLASPYGRVFVLLTVSLTPVIAGEVQRRSLE